jgi:hypothetical protein
LQELIHRSEEAESQMQQANEEATSLKNQLAEAQKQASFDL